MFFRSMNENLRNQRLLIQRKGVQLMASDQHNKPNAGSGGHSQQGAKAEKGDQRRDKPQHSGPTRPGGSRRGKPGSDTNPEKDE
jgi:hypothetical protein